MALKDESARARILASLTFDLSRTLARAHTRAWTAGEILGAAASLRPIFLEGEGPLGIAFAQPGFILAALLAAWGAKRRPLLFDPGLKREAEALRRIHPGICIYADKGPTQAAASDGRVSLAEALAASQPAAAQPAWLTLPTDDEPFAALLTSASGGENKVVDKRGFQIYRQAEALSSVLALPAGSRVLSFVPPFHLLGFFYGLVLPLVLGGETVVATDLTGAAMTELLAKYSPGLVVGSATHYRFLAKAASRGEPASDRAALAESPSKIVPPSATVYLSSGAPLDPLVAEAFASRYGTPVRDFYGSTELGGVAFRAWPAPYQAMPGVRWRIDAETAGLEVISPWAGGAQGAWLSTDDAAEPAGENGFRLLGRLDHVVKVGGKRFSSVEVEQALRAMPGVAEAAVFPYQRFGEPAIAAVLSPEPHAVLGEAAARAFLAERLAGYKLPRTILVLATLPRGSHDKIDYQALRALLAQEVSGP
jgi:acyl-coenzyme A synthetase/AMP-(fatty) acid ligase